MVCTLCTREAFAIDAVPDKCARCEKNFKVGMWLRPDGWGNVGPVDLRPGDAPVDDSYRGCAFRIKNSTDRTSAINLYPSGKANPRFEQWAPGPRKVFSLRVRIEWVGDGEPSDWSLGTLYWEE